MTFFTILPTAGPYFFLLFFLVAMFLVSA
jgi:hypothetical protein